MNRNKLIALLASELEEWPETAADAQRMLPAGFFWRGDHVLYLSEAKFVNREDWEVERIRLANKPEAPAWDGEGRPPVGVPIEQKHRDATPEWANPDFHETTIVAMGKQLAIFTHPGSDHETVGRIADYDFRPIRTEEDKAVEAMAWLLADEFDANANDCIDAARALYRAGYRKQEAS